MLFPAPDGTLWLMWTAQLAGNQDTAIIRRRLSRDHGKSWGPIETLFPEHRGRGTFIRQPIVVLDNGDWLLPVFYCHSTPGKKWNGDEDTSAVKISSDAGATWRDIDVPGSRGCVHMCIARLDDGSLIAVYRSRWADNIYQSRSTDHGRSWSAPVATALPNNNSSVQLTRLGNGHLALVFNDSSSKDATGRRLSLYDEIEDDLPPVLAGDGGKSDGRTAFWGAPRAPMTLAISTDGGKSWAKRNVETGDGYCMTNNSRDQTNRELSYPSVKQTADGAIHTAFTFHRRAIKYVRVSETVGDAGLRSWTRGTRSSRAPVRGLELRSSSACCATAGASPGSAGALGRSTIRRSRICRSISPMSMPSRPPSLISRRRRWFMPPACSRSVRWDR